MYPPSSPNKRRATHQIAPPSHKPKMMNGSRMSHGRGMANDAFIDGESTFRIEASRRTGAAAITPVAGEVTWNSWPGLVGNPEAMYSYSRSENLRPVATHRHWKRKNSSRQQAKICGRPTLNSLIRSSMKCHLYHGGITTTAFQKEVAIHQILCNKERRSSDSFL